MNLRLIFCAGLLFAGPISAQAHAFLDSAEPAVGSAVKQSPQQVKIWFTRQLRTEGSTVAVFDAGGVQVDLKTCILDPKNRFLLTVAVPTLPAGHYKVVWNAVCLGDSHHTTGSFTFDVTGSP